jgi:hypothetical protein
LKEGHYQGFGARDLKGAMQLHVVFPFANLLATDQVRSGDMISISCEPQQNRLTFTRGGENVAPPARRLKPVHLAHSSQAHAERVEFPLAPFSPEPAPRFAS